MLSLSWLSRWELTKKGIIAYYCRKIKLSPRFLMKHWAKYKNSVKGEKSINKETLETAYKEEWEEIVTAFTI